MDSVIVLRAEEFVVMNRRALSSRSLLKELRTSHNCFSVAVVVSLEDDMSEEDSSSKGSLVEDGQEIIFTNHRTSISKPFIYRMTSHTTSG